MNCQWQKILAGTKRYISGNWGVFVVAVIAYAIVFIYAFTHDYTAVSDSSLEYKLYLHYIEVGSWGYIDKVLNSCLMTVYFPAVIQRITNIEPLLLFKLWACLWIPLLPIALYHIARQYLNNVWAMLPPLLLMSQAYFLWSPSFARVLISIGFYAITIYFIFYYRGSMWFKGGVIILSVVLMCLSHYGIPLVGLLMLLFTWVVSLVYRKAKRIKQLFTKELSIAVITLVVVMTIWYGFVAQQSFSNIAAIVRLTIAPHADNDIVGKIMATEATKVQNNGESAQSKSELSDEPSVPQEAQSKGEINKTDKMGISEGYFNLATRGEVIWSAFGKNLGVMNNAQRTEWVLSWITIILFSLGLVYTTRRMIKGQFKDIEIVILAWAGYGVILLVIIIPQLSIWYGINKAYLHALVPLSVMFAIGIKKYIRKPLLGFMLVGGLMLCTTGTLHMLLGYDR